MKAHLVFDLDGTLVDSLPGIAEGLNRALHSLGLPGHSAGAVRGMIGRGARNLCAAGIGYADAALAPPAELEAVHAAFRHEYPLSWQGANTRPYPGMDHLLARTVAAGARVAILSNKPHDVTQDIVHTLFPTVPFDPLLGHTGRFPRKPDPAALHFIAESWGVAPAELTLVGDSLFDARTAANAGSACALVAWGYADIRELIAWGCPIFGTAEELAKHLLN